ncbi:lipocalin family protein [Acinetobacter sp. TR3]|jgi:apolipoprotein D and lipocalin family protein|uniref:lipocalin family protein n=1 Tax=uncultured Acinetobacter sp. TaxID=165433 RepID=UPI0022AC6030|nr:lipocalin family protein [Acinetobacter sp. TR3]WAU75750.1 lipocalin family protein [Acinetobacter sp. TR3]
MKAKTLLGMTILSAAMTAVVIPMQANAEKPSAVDKIDVNQYAGKWYEIAHLPMYFQRHCLSDTTAVYTLNPDKTIGVLNSCRTKTGQMDSSQGVAYPANSGNSKLKVSFLPKGLRWLPFTKGDYWVLRVDPEYKVALVGGPSTKYLWLLSKTPTIDDATYNSYLETAKQQGYDLSKLIKTPHRTP